MADDYVKMDVRGADKVHFFLTTAILPWIIALLLVLALFYAIGRLACRQGEPGNRSLDECIDIDKTDGRVASSASPER